MPIRWITGFLDSPDRSAESFWLAVTSSGGVGAAGSGRGVRDAAAGGR
jgi:hypothetical protein